MAFFKIWNKFSRKKFPIFSEKFVPTLAMTDSDKCDDDIYNDVSELYFEWRYFGDLSDSPSKSKD